MSLKLDKTTMSLFAARLSKCGPQVAELPKLLNFKNEEGKQTDIIANATLAIVHFFKNGMLGRGRAYQWVVFSACEIIEKYCSRLSGQIQAILKDWEVKQAVRNIVEEAHREHVMAQRPKMPEYQSSFHWSQKDLAKNKYERMVSNGASVQKNEGGAIGKFNDNKLTEVCLNLVDKPECLCEFPRHIKDKQEISFLCVHCNRRFHTVCMRKKTTSEFCCYCHLQKMVPLKKPVKTVFMGILRKTKKKHQAYFQIPEIQSNQRLQIRCLRLKEDAQQACLFPDIAELSMNGQRIVNYEPINRHSCLKYRKDQPYNLLKGDYYKGQENSFLLSEAVTLTRQRDVRNDPQNHLLGVFIVQDIKIDQFIEASKAENILGFSQSQAALQGTFGLGKDDEITCEIVKIPLLCPLTTVKIEIPARGYYCTHYQCFDMKNYLTLISESQNPRWTCPLCKSMSFELKIDSILMEVIKETKTNEKIKEILFFKNGDYSAIIDDQPLQQKKNIRSLNIPEKVRNRPQQPEKEQQKQVERARPRKRAPFVMPEHAEFISLDD